MNSWEISERTTKRESSGSSSSYPNFKEKLAEKKVLSFQKFTKASRSLKNTFTDKQGSGGWQLGGKVKRHHPGNSKSSTNSDFWCNIFSKNSIKFFRSNLRSQKKWKNAEVYYKTHTRSKSSGYGGRRNLTQSPNLLDIIVYSKGVPCTERLSSTIRTPKSNVLFFSGKPLGVTKPSFKFCL